MTALVPLHRGDPVDGARVHALPAWLAPTGKALYWHKPRSATLHADGRISALLWCGQLRHVRTLDHFSHDPPEDLQCGTCVGRKAGYDREDGLIFTPRDVFALPAWCPGRDQGDGTCLACGHRVRYYNRGYGGCDEAKHHPVPDVLFLRCEPCPRHGWRDLRHHGGRLVCGVWGCSHDGGPR